MLLASTILGLITVALGGFLNVGDNSFIITDLDDTHIVTKGIADLHYPFACITKCWILIDEKLVETDYQKPQNLTDSSSVLEKPESVQKQSKKDLSLLIQHTDRVFWAKEYRITARVFDKSLNPNGDYWATFGFIKNADVHVSIVGPLPEKTSLVTLHGKTSNTGYYQDKFYITSNLVSGGTYDVIVNATDGTSEVSKTIPLIIIGQVPDNGRPQP